MSNTIRRSLNSKEPVIENPVYCSECKWIAIELRTRLGPDGGMYSEPFHVCTSPYNTKTINTWLAKTKKYSRSPKVINKLNKCSWFERAVFDTPCSKPVTATYDYAAEEV